LAALLISAPFAVLTAGLLVATVVDLRTRRIPNVLTGTMAGAGIGLAAFGFGFGGLSVGAAVLGCVIGLVLMLPGHALGATGAGDVKLMAAVGSLLGPLAVVNAVLFSAVAGGVLAVIVALQRRRLVATLAGTGRMIAAPADVKSEIASGTPASRFAYGPAIAAGSMLAALMRL
jgi:prepilin peptidase CpaA